MSARCIITDQPITPANNSKAHVIPSALGGRLKPLDILSRCGNGLAGDKFDLPLIEGFQSLMNLLNGSRDRGENRATRMTDESGKRYVFQFGEPLSLAAPEYTEVDVGGETQVTIKARTFKEARTLLGRIKAKNPAFDIDEAMKHAVLEHQWPDGLLHHQLQIGASVVFPAAFVAASIFAAYHKQNPHPLLKTYVSAFEASEPTMPPDTFYFMPGKPWISTSSEITHIVALITNASARQMFVYIELFNLACVGVLLPFEGQADVCETHGVDVLTGQEVPVQLDRTAVMSTPWVATHHVGDASLLSFTQHRTGELVRLAQQREWDANIKGIVSRAFGPEDGRPLMPRDYANLIGEVAEFLKLLWKHPAFTSDVRKAELPRFEAFCAQFERRLPAFARQEFRQLTAEHRTALAEAAEDES